MGYCVKRHEAERKWWTALSGWLERHQGRADFLFVYDKKQGRLDRCFDRNVTLGTVDAETISKLYQAAAEGRLGLLRPHDLKPQLLTTDPEKMFSPEKEPSAAAEKGSASAEQPSAEMKEEGEPSKQAESAEIGEASETAPALDSRKLERTAADPAMAERMREAEAQYRQVVYAPPKAENPAPAEGLGGEVSAARMRAKQAAALEQTVEMIRNALPPEVFGSEPQLVAELAKMILSIKEPKKQDEERLERERKAKEELIAAQNLFIWAAASEKRDREQFEARMEQLDLQMVQQEPEWRKPLENMARMLRKMDLDGASEDECSERIRDFLDGKEPNPQAKAEAQAEGDPEAQDEAPVSGEVLGNALLHFCRFAASEVPLSIRHVQAAELCRRILQEAKDYGIAQEELGLDSQGWSIVRGTMEMGKLVEQGLLAQAALTSGQRLSRPQHRACLRDYLAMKGMEETLIPHVQMYEKEISAGEGPASALQILMSHQGFHADDLRAKAGKTSAMVRLERMDPRQVAEMIRQGSGELGAMGRQVMIASCQMDGPEPAREPKEPQKSGPVL